MEVAEVRRRLRAAIEQARRTAAARRERSDAAAREYEVFLTGRAVPLIRTLAAALVAEGHRFKMFTPAASVRLVSERSAEDYIEVVLDTSQDPPRVIGRTSRGRGRGNVTSERPVREGAEIADLTDDVLLEFYLSELTAFLAR